MPDQINLTNQRFGRWSVLDLSHHSETAKDTYWNCQCDCGAIKPVSGNSLRRGKSTSCGCYRAEVKTPHGMFQTPTYNSWSTMKQRCLNSNATDYDKYGGRGITVDSNWNTFEGFLKDMGERPDGMTLDRRNTNGPYSKENCRWATNIEQQNNKTDNHRIEYNGAVYSPQQLASELSIPVHTVYSRLSRGFTPEEICNPELRKRK